MMVFLAMVKKNLRLLVRSKSSAFIVFLGPLLIIALVGLVFSGKGTSDLSIGYFAQEKTNLTVQFVERLEEDFVVREFPSEEQCTESIEQGLLHTCIIFPEGFEIREEGGSELRFVVDNSRINLVYQVIDSVSSILESETREVSYSLTSLLLDGINKTVAGLDRSGELSGQISQAHDEADAALLRSVESSGAMSLGGEPIGLDLITLHAQNLNLTLGYYQESVNDSIREGLELLRELDSYISSNESEEIRARYLRIEQEMSTLGNASVDQVDIIISDIGHLGRVLARLDAQLEQDRQLKAQVEQGLADVSLSLAQARDSVAQIESLSLRIRDDLEGITVRRADTIVSPVNTRIEPIAPKSSNILFTFPFLLMLVVMFVTLMLSSTMIVYEKTSKASFRNFMMPIGRGWMVLSYVVTIILVVLFQSLIILNLAQAALGIDLLSNPWTTIAVVVASALFFTVLGLSIGWLVSTQEAGVMASLVFGSVFLFVSNLVVPLESLAPAFSRVIAWNPYIIFSELLRRSLLFSAGLGELALALGIAAAVSLLGLLILSYATNRN